MASAMQDLQLPSQIVLVPNVCCLMSEAHVCEQFAQSHTRKRSGCEFHSRPTDHKSRALPLCH